jgi:hypothetical protein
MPNFRIVDDRTMKAVPFFQAIHLHDGEILIGLYDNLLGGNESEIVVTNLGLYINNSGEADFIEYRSIKEVEIPKDMEKTKLDYFIVRLSDGQSKKIPITGGHDRFKDVYEFIRFVERVKDDVMGDIY